MFKVLHGVDHPERAQAQQSGPEAEVEPEALRLSFGLHGGLKSGDEDNCGENDLREAECVSFGLICTPDMGDKDFPVPVWCRNANSLRLAEGRASAKASIERPHRQGNPRRRRLRPVHLKSKE